MKYPVVIYPCEEGGYVSEILALPGCMAQGETLEECLEELDTVTDLWMENAAEQNTPIPDFTTAIDNLKSYNQVISQ